MTDTEETTEYVRKRGLEDLIYFARVICGFTKSKLEYKDEHGVKHKIEREGAEYGISRLGPHERMAALVQSPSQAKYLSAPRDSYKSTLALCAMAQWICQNPDIRILYAQTTKREAQKKIDACARLVNSKRLQDIYGVKLVKDGDLWIAENRSPRIIDPTLEAGGVDSELTGSHRDRIVLDDPVTWLNVRNPEGIKKTRAYFDLLQPLLDPMGILLVIATLYDFADLSHDIMNTMSDEFETLILDCGMTPKREPGGAVYLVGKPRFAHLTEEYLLSRLRRMRYKHFMANYCARIVNTEQETFQRKQFRCRTYTPAIARSVRGFIFTDTAVSEDRSACFRVVAACGLDSNDIAYLFDMKIGRWPSQMIAVHVCNMIEKWHAEGLKFGGICLEKTTMNEAYQAQIQGEMRARGLNVRFIRTPRGLSQGSKDNRIEQMGLRFDQGRFIVMSSVERFYEDDAEPRLLFDPEGWTENDVALPAGELVEQFIRWPNYPFKDIPDALADLDVCDKDGNRLIRGAGTAPRLDIWASQRHAKDQAERHSGVKAAIQGLLQQMQTGSDQSSLIPPWAARRRVAGDRWRHLN